MEVQSIFIELTLTNVLPVNVLMRRTPHTLCTGTASSKKMSAECIFTLAYTDVVNIST